MTAQNTRPELVKAWQKTFGFKPPPLMSLEFMTANLSYAKQVKEAKINTTQLHKRLMAIAEGLEGKPNLRHTTTKPGTVVIRMWQGEPHEVTIQGSSEYHYRGQQYKSLSAIANHITGTRWNGQAFFGLRKAQTGAR